MKNPRLSQLRPGATTQAFDLTAFDTWTWNRKSVAVPCLAGGATATVRLGPIDFDLGSNGSGGCRPIDQHFDLYFNSVLAYASYDMRLLPNEVRIEAENANEGNPLFYECPMGECPGSSKCILPGVGCDY